MRNIFDTAQPPFMRLRSCSVVTSCCVGIRKPLCWKIPKTWKNGFIFLKTGPDCIRHSGAQLYGAFYSEVTRLIICGALLRRMSVCIKCSQSCQSSVRNFKKPTFSILNKGISTLSELQVSRRMNTNGSKKRFWLLLSCLLALGLVNLQRSDEWTDFGSWALTFIFNSCVAYRYLRSNMTLL